MHNIYSIIDVHSSLENYQIMLFWRFFCMVNICRHFYSISISIFIYLRLFLFLFVRTLGSCLLPVFLLCVFFFLSVSRSCLHIWHVSPFLIWIANIKFIISFFLWLVWGFFVCFCLFCYVLLRCYFSPNWPIDLYNHNKVSKQISSESESRSVVSNSLPPHGLYSPWNSPGQNTGVGSLSLLQGIFPSQGSNPGLSHCRRILYQLSHKGSTWILEWVAYPFSISRPRNWTGVSFIAGGFFTSWAIREAHVCPDIWWTLTIQFQIFHRNANY